VEYNLEIKVFELREKVNLPLAEDPEKIANMDSGDILVCFDGIKVFAKNWNTDGTKSFAMLLNDITFIEANPTFFRNISGN